MKKKEGFILRKVAGVHVVVATGGALVDFDGMFSLNDVGAFLWENLASETSADELAEKVAARYHVAPSLAERDLAPFLARLRENRLLVE